MEVMTQGTGEEDNIPRDLNRRGPLLRTLRRTSSHRTSKSEWNEQSGPTSESAQHPKGNVRTPTSQPSHVKDGSTMLPTEKGNRQDGQNYTLAALSRKGSSLVKKSRDSVGSLLRFSDANEEAVETRRQNGDIPLQSEAVASPPRSPLRRGYSDSAWLPKRSAKAATSVRVANEKPVLTPPMDSQQSFFANLNADCQRFTSKPVESRTSILRPHLQFFLHTRPGAEEGIANLTMLKQRRTVLDRWWRAILDTLIAGINGLLSPPDRRTLHTAITGIVQRPEWLPWSPADTETMVTQTVHMQLNFLVNRLSNKSTSVESSLITLAAKFFAIAWFRCAGVGQILCQLWKIPARAYNRLAFPQAGRNSRKPRPHSQASAPPPSHGPIGLHFPNLQAYTSFLRQPLSISGELRDVAWQNPNWLAKWSGRESGLFFEFLETFYTLLAEMPNETDIELAMSSTLGVTVVNAQILAVMESMIPRSQGSSAVDLTGVPSPSIGGVEMANINASAAALSIPPVKTQRPVAGSSLIITIREFLLRPGFEHDEARLMLAEALTSVLVVVAKGVSTYDQSACFALCDIIQEVFPIVAQFQTSRALHTPFIDWKFWCEVFALMLITESTLTELRLYILLYTLWDMIPAVLKTKLCQDNLLEESFFLSRFSHWCPMVRTYFMRLVCWRIARVDDDVAADDAEIPKLLLSRLLTVWKCYEHDNTNTANGATLAVIPCNPVPGRRLFIIRTDMPGISLQSSPMPKYTAAESQQNDAGIEGFRLPFSNGGFSPAQLAEKLSQALTTEDAIAPKRRNNLFRSIMGTRSPESGSRSESPQRKSSSQTSTPEQRSPRTSFQSPQKPTSAPSTGRSSFHEHRPAPEPPAKKPSSKPPSGASTPRVPTNFTGCFRFSLEPIDPRRAAFPALEPEQPRLPLPEQKQRELFPDLTDDVKISAPKLDPATTRALKYSGRALVEWKLTVMECQNFFERRRAEGVPSDKLVETPILGVESLRRPV